MWNICKTFSSVWVLFSFRLCFHWFFEHYCFLNSLSLPLILLLFLKCGSYDVSLYPFSALHTDGHPDCLLWRRGGFSLATSTSWLRTVCVRLLAIFWGQGIYCSSHFICSLKEWGAVRKNSAEALCSLCWRFPIPVALLSLGKDLWAVLSSFSLVVGGSFPWGVEYFALRTGHRLRPEAWNIQETQPYLFTSITSTCCLQRLFPKLPQMEKRKRDKALAFYLMVCVCQGETQVRYCISHPFPSSHSYEGCWLMMICYPLVLPSPPLAEVSSQKIIRLVLPSFSTFYMTWRDQILCCGSSCTEILK